MGFQALALFAIHVIVASSSPAECELMALLQSKNGKSQSEIQLPAEVREKPKTAVEVDQTQLLQSSTHAKQLSNPVDPSSEDLLVAPDVAFASVASTAFALDQQRCIDNYVMEVKTVMPEYDLSDRKFGGSSGKFPRHAKAPILAPGFGTTGTRSVCELGRKLGLRVHHFSPHAYYNDILMTVDHLLVQNCSERKKLNDVNYLKIMLSPSIKEGNEPVDMMMDVPISELFLDFYAASPDSKVLLTKRDPTEWAVERKAHHKNTVMPVQSPCGGHFGDLPEHKLAKLMEYHHTLVRCMVPAEKLLEVDIFQDDDTTKIAEFVGRPLKSPMPMPQIIKNPWMHHKDKK